MYNTSLCLLIVCGNIGSIVAVVESSTNLVCMVYEPTVNLAWKNDEANTNLLWI